VSTHRESRIEDFQRRAAQAPTEVSRHPPGAWPYIAVHHFAEETDAPVRQVDCWCLLGADAALLECVSEKESKWPVGLYARIDAASPHWPKLHAIIPAPLTRMAVEQAMQRFVELGFPDPLIAQLPPGGSLCKLSA
jgi:hypothetical protein